MFIYTEGAKGNILGCDSQASGPPVCQLKGDQVLYRSALGCGMFLHEGLASLPPHVEIHGALAPERLKVILQQTRLSFCHPLLPPTEPFVARLTK